MVTVVLLLLLPAVFSLSMFHAPVDAAKIARAQGDIARAKGVTQLARECQPVVSITS